MSDDTKSTLGQRLSLVEIGQLAAKAGATKGVSGLWICHPEQLRRIIDLAIDMQLPGIAEQIGMEEDL